MTADGRRAIERKVLIGTAINFVIGFVSAALIAALVIPLFVKRATRRAVGRALAATPYAPEEIRADKDELRARLAVSARRLEVTVAAMKTRALTKITELGEKSDVIDQLKNDADAKDAAIARLRGEVEEKTAAVLALEERNRALGERLRTATKQFEIRGRTLRQKEDMLADKEAELVRLVAELGEHTVLADRQRGEIDAMREQVDAIRLSIAGYEEAFNEAAERWPDDDDAGLSWADESPAQAPDYDRRGATRRRRS